MPTRDELLEMRRRMQIAAAQLNNSAQTFSYADATLEPLPVPEYPYPITAEANYDSIQTARINAEMARSTRVFDEARTRWQTTVAGISENGLIRYTNTTPNNWEPATVSDRPLLPNIEHMSDRVRIIGPYHYLVLTPNENAHTDYLRRLYFRCRILSEEIKFDKVHPFESPWFIDIFLKFMKMEKLSSGDNFELHEVKSFEFKKLYECYDASYTKQTQVRAILPYPEVLSWQKYYEEKEKDEYIKLQASLFWGIQPSLISEFHTEEEFKKVLSGS